MIAAFELSRGSVVTGVLTFYLASTALLTLRRPVEQTRGLLTGLLCIALATSAYAFSLAMEALHSAR